MDTRRRLITLPNILTLSRLLTAPALALAVLSERSPWLAVILVTLAAVTDLLDGVIARANTQISNFGAMLDPIADKVFVVTALLLLLEEGLLKGAGAWAVLIIVWRELLISGVRDYARFMGFGAPVSFLAKVKTAAQFSSVIALYAARIPALNSTGLAEIGIALLWAAAALSLYTGANYLWLAWRRAWK